MRITSGKYRNRKILSPKGNDTRPASDRVRQAVFNMLRSYALPDNAIVVDLFCGTGSYGLEALSRGAQSCIFIDQSTENLKLCQENCTELNIHHQTKITRHDLTKPLPKGLFEELKNQRASVLFFIDPPYHKGLIESVADHLRPLKDMKRECAFVFEMEKSLNWKDPDFNILKEKTYGQSRIVIANFR